MFAASKTGAPASPPVYVEDVFSTYLYTGNGSTQTITNGIDLAGKGGLVWVKGRTSAWEHKLTDTVRGATKALISNTTGAETTDSNGLTSFSTTGFVLGSDTNYNWSGGGNYVSWTFREQAKFFDVVTYTGTGSTRSVSHNLGSVPGFVIVKNTSNTADWAASLAPDGDWNNRKLFLLNTTNADGDAATYTNGFINTATSTTVSLTQNAGTNVNASGNTYVMYLFAHNAGGFGLTGTDNVISCGSYTGNGSTTGPIINLGWEPQWILLKPSTVVDNWNMYDNMRGATVSGSATLYANTANAEGAIAANVAINATGFQPISTNSGVNGNGQTYIYIAIRRGPMKTPTSGTSVFSAVTYTGAGAGTTYTTNFPVDMTLVKSRTTVTQTEAWDRLRGGSKYLLTDATDAEATFGGPTQWQSDRMTSILWNAGDGYSNVSPNTYGTWNFLRSPSVFDVVCYTGTGSATTFNHNLTVVPELMIVKRRSAANAWAVYANNDNTDYLVLNTTAATADDNTYWNDTSPTSSVFSVGTNNAVNASASTYVAYLFATCAGVSKVGSYTGTGALQTVNCGFAAGARFVLIKRFDSTGDWYVWDSARGISSGNDPYLLINSTAAEVTGTNYVDTTAVGFQVTAAAPAALNASGGTFLFLAIA